MNALPSAPAFRSNRPLRDAGVDAAPMAPAAPPVAEGPLGSVIVVAKARGGVGATTTAVNLAQALREGPGRKAGPARRVAVVDFDVQNGSVGAFLDVEDTGAVIDLLRTGDLPDAGLLGRALVQHPSGLAVLPAPIEMAPVDALTAPMVDRLIALLRARFDHVVVDLPAAVLPSVTPLLRQAGQLLVVTDTSVPSIRQASRLIGVLTEDNFTLPVSVVVTREARPFRLSASLKEAQAVLGRGFDHWIPRDDRTARRAADLGQPVAGVARRSAMARAYRRLAEEIAATAPAPRH